MAQGKDRGEGTWMPDDIGGLPSRELSLAEKVILSRIISLSVGRPCEMSNAGFASRFGISTRQVTNHIKSLQEKAWIEVMGPRTKRYIKPTEKALSLWKKPSIEETNYRRKLLEKKTSPTIEETFPNYRRNLLPKNTENTKNTSICANADLRKRASSQQDETETMFNEFWQAYPKKRDKARARKSFFKIKNLSDVFPHLMQGLEQQKASADWKKDGGKYIPLPSSWLNGERWEDELTTQAQPPVSPSSAWGGIPIVGSASDETEEERRARVEAAIQEQQANTRANN
jgi:DNA-binding MarR family transcriptional regulator